MARLRAPTLFLVVAAALLASCPVASANPGNCTVEQPPAPSSRIVHASLDGLELNVLLPSGYGTSGRRYPVLYLLHGADYNENSWLRLTDLEQFTAPFTGDHAAIVVMPDGGPMGWYVDWYQGNEQWETYHLKRLLPYIDSHFRTLADRGHRAIAGFSIGGYGAAGYAARHPDLFSSVGSFSGLDHLTFPEAPYSGAAPAPARTGAGDPGAPYGGADPRPYAPPTDSGSGCGPQDGSATGNPVTDRVVWHGRNPADLAENLRGVSVYLSAGNGVPCDAADAIQPPAFGTPLEPGVRQMNDAFDAALTVAQVPHTSDFHSCGLHTMRYAQAGLHAYWPTMLAGFGRPAPSSFSMRSIDPDFSAYGWSFHADPRRALEFLEVSDASPHGATLTGSGTETVVTPSLFKRHQRVGVAGALPRRPRADSAGRLTLRVDLGPPHESAQFTPGAGAPAFIKRVVKLKPSRTRITARRTHPRRRRHTRPGFTG